LILDSHFTLQTVEAWEEKVCRYDHSLALDLTGNNSITADGWSLFTELFEPSATSQIKELRLGSESGFQPRIDNDTFIDLVESLSYTRNTCLEKLYLHGTEMSASRWDALACTSCDTSSMDNIVYNSNHTLHEIYGLAQRPPINIKIALSINSIKDKAEVIRRKILFLFF